QGGRLDRGFPAVVRGQCPEGGGEVALTAFSVRQRRRQCDAAMKGADEGRRRPWVLTRRGPGAWVMWLAGSPAAVLRRLRLGWRAYSLRGKPHAAMRVRHRGNEYLRVFARL